MRASYLPKHVPDYVAADHPLRPARKSLILDHPRTLHRFPNHSEFWWEVLLAMQKRAKINESRNTDQALRDEIIQLADQIQNLRRERTTTLAQKDAAEAKVVRLNREIEKMKREHEQDQAVIAHLSSRHRTAESNFPQRIDDRTPQGTAEIPGVETTRRTTTRYTSTLPEQPHHNPKFPDAPMFSGDRTTFDSWKDKVYDKLPTASPNTRPTIIRSHMSKAERKEWHINKFEHSVSQDTLALSRRLTKSSTHLRKFTETRTEEPGPLMKCVHCEWEGSLLMNFIRILLAAPRRLDTLRMP
ncbi:hypothetical protein DL98DRAFT_212455 [Cadophora sp. DSE1049]|nr:hypothetical protein DL98DRAFT_212455 [Cadophora sp. DSE1049]